MMNCEFKKILGIVAEYDPFHNGHLYHVIEARKQVAPDLTYIVLSPCLKQRGELSLLSPVDRARCALDAGANAVFSLPVLWTLRDAEHYAIGAVSLLAGLGVTHIAFGAETADLPLLSRAADFLEHPTKAFNEGVKSVMSSGKGWPAAVSAALSAALPEAANLLSHPNNILAVSYLRAIRRLGLSLAPVIIPRTGSYHASSVNPASPSASSIRDALLRGNYADAFTALPDCTVSVLRRRLLDNALPDESILSHLLLAKLRSVSAMDFRSLPDLSEGMENALETAAASCRTRRELIAALTGRRYPAARISRLCACALLNLSADDLRYAPLPNAAFLLGLKNDPTMTSLWKKLPIPVVSSFKEWKKAAHPADLAAWSLWSQCCRLPDTLPFTEQIAVV